MAATTTATGMTTPGESAQWRTNTSRAKPAGTDGFGSTEKNARGKAGRQHGFMTYLGNPRDAS